MFCLKGAGSFLKYLDFHKFTVKKGIENADDNTSYYIQCIYDNCLVWASEIQKCTPMVGNFNKLGDSIF